jgi:two-component system chemotaxis response regulator CheB
MGEPTSMKKGYTAVVIGTSAGGMNALDTILSQLVPEFMMSVVIVQHTLPTSDHFLARHLNDVSPLRVKQADEKEIIQPGAVYIAPANYHLLIETDKTFSLSVDELVNYSRPSIDVLFESAADAYGSRLVGMILTGGNVDGSYGLKVIKEAGGLTIVQNPDTAEADAMPRAAMAAAAIDHILPLEKISAFLNLLDAEGNLLN